MAYFVDMVYTVHVGLGSWGAEGAEGAEGARLYDFMSKMSNGVTQHPRDKRRWQTEARWLGKATVVTLRLWRIQRRQGEDEKQTCAGKCDHYCVFIKFCGTCCRVYEVVIVLAHLQWLIKVSIKILLRISTSKIVDTFWQNQKIWQEGLTFVLDECTFLQNFCNYSWKHII